MNRSGQRMLLQGCLLLAGLLLLVTWLRVRSTARGATEPVRAPAIRTDRGSLAPPAGREALPSGSAAGVAKDRILFRFDDGTPAKGLPLYRADVVKTSYPRAIREDPPNWTYRLDSAGELVLAGKVDLGSIVAVRLSDSAVELVPLDPTRVREYELRSLTDQEFVLRGGPGGPDTSAEIELRGGDNRQFSSYVAYEQDARRTGFADHYSVEAKELPSGSVVAYARLGFTGERPSARLRLPKGTYDLQPVSCPFGWWWKGMTALLDGTPVEISLTPVPITRVRLPLDADGATRTPLEVRLFIDTKTPDSAPSSGELQLHFEVHDDEVSVAQHWRAPDETWTRYALIFVWPDGTRTKTKLGDWNELLNTTDVGGPER